MNKQLSLIPRNDYEAIVELLQSISRDAELFYHKNNNRAGTRMTVSLRKIEKKIKQTRLQAYKIKKSRKQKVVHGGPYDYEWGK